MADWKALERFNRSGLSRWIVPAGRDIRAPWRLSDTPPTAEEVATAEAERQTAERERMEKQAFEARQEYKDADAIRAVLEWMTPSDNPLDRLTPEEWAELRAKLSK